MSNKALSVYAEALKRGEQENQELRKTTRESTQPRDDARAPSRASARKVVRGNLREGSRDSARNDTQETPRVNGTDLPTRDDIQAFTFRLRDELKVKVQAEVPHHWQDELEELARELNVKKLELYRFILGEFLGKVTRSPRSAPDETR